MDKRIRQSFQMGGIAQTKQQQQVGLNNDTYNSMSFPGSGNRMFRGLDSGAPVYIKDQSGKQKVLRGPQDTDQFYGHVQEQRMQQGGRAPIYVSDPHDPEVPSIFDYSNAKPQQPIVYQPEVHPNQYADINNPGRTVIGNQTQGAPHHSPPTQDYLNYIRMQNRAKPNYKQLPTNQPNQLPADIPQQQLQQREIFYDNTQPMMDGSVKMLQYERDHPDDRSYQGKGFKYGGNLNNNTMAKRKDFTIPGFKYGGAAIIPDTNPYGTGTDFVPVEYRRVTNGMMQNGGYLDFMSYPEAPNTYQHGGPTTDYRPSNENNASVQFVNDKHGYNNMQTPGYHYTNDGFKKTTGSNMNGASWSKFGGEINNQFMPAPLEYAMLQNGGHYSQTGGSVNGQMMYDTDEMKEGGIHIKKSHEGRFTEYKKRTGKTTEEALHSSDPHVRQMANFAKNAKSWAKKEFGGEVASKLSKFIKMQTGGPWSTTGNIPADVTAGRDSAQATAESQTSNTPLTTQMDSFNTQQAQHQAVSPQYATDAPSTDIAPDNGQYSATPDTLPKPNGARQAADAFGNILGAGLATASFFEDRNKQRQMQGFNRSLGQSDSAFGAQKLNTAGNKGDYNQQGVFRPNQNTPTAPALAYSTAQMGGYQGPYTGSVPQSKAIADVACYAMGGEFNNVPDEHLNELRKRGFKIDYI